MAGRQRAGRLRGLRLLGALQIADVSAQVALGFHTDFTGFTQFTAWSKALAATRS